MFVVSLTDAADDDPNIIQGFTVSVVLTGRSSCLNRNRLCNVVWAISLFVLTSCGGGGGGAAPVSFEYQPVIVADSFVPTREQAVGFPDTAAVSRQERQRVDALHQCGGTGKGQVVGIFDSGVNLDHPDLTGQFQYICSMGHCNGKDGSHDDRRPALDRIDRSPLHDTDGHGTPVNAVVAAHDSKRPALSGYGLSSTAPSAYFATGMTLSSKLPALHDSRLALALSSGLRHPLGWAGTGAFEMEGQAIELGWGQLVSVSNSLSFYLTGRLAHLNPESGPLLSFDKVLLMAADMTVAEQTKARITFGREQPVSSAAAHLRAAQAVSSDGRITSSQIRFSTAELVTFDRFSLGLRHFTHNASNLGVGITALRDGFGQTEVFTGFSYNIQF